MSTRILTVGAVLGSFSSLFTKVKAIDAKHGKFELLLCAGDFFGPAGDEGELELLLEGTLDVTIPTYITQGQYPIPSRVLEKTAETGGEIRPNVFLLGKSRIITTSQKLTIAAFGGRYDEGTYQNVDLTIESPAFNATSVASFLKSPSLPVPMNSIAQPSFGSFKSSTPSAQVDILLTYGWPASIAKLSKTVPPSLNSDSSVPPLDEIAVACRPRYHFASGGASPPPFWEREPFLWRGGQVDGAITRFISLGAFGGPSDAPGGKRPRWFYAFSIAPITASVPPPANISANPFQLDTIHGTKRSVDEDDNGGNFIFGEVKRPRHDQRDFRNQGKASAHIPTKKPPEGYVCHRCHSTEHYIFDCTGRPAIGDTGGNKPPPGYICRGCGSGEHLVSHCPHANGKPRHEPVKEIQPDECWFCLSNPRLAKHLIVSIGTEVYITLAKGQLPPTDRDTASPTRVPGGGHLLIIPISHYPTISTIPADLAPPILSEIDTYKSALRTMYAKFGAIPLFFEMSRLSGRGGHAHVQVVPIPESKKTGVEEAFKAYGGQQVDWEDDPVTALGKAVGGRMGYFRVDLPDGRKMVHVLRPGKMFNLQFGREALAHYLELKGRADWTACSQSEEEESADAGAFKDAFREYDPALL